MAFIGLDGIVEELVVAVNSSAVVLPISNGAALCTRLGAGMSKLRISDGIYEEIVTVTGCSGTYPVVVRGQEGTTARPFAAGACVSYVITTATICDLINNGECSPVVACTPLTVVAGSQFPDAETGVPYGHALAWTGSAPATVTVYSKPSWMTINPIGVTSGNSIVLAGTPGVSSTGDIVQLSITNCGGKYETNQRIDYCSPVGATV